MGAVGPIRAVALASALYAGAIACVPTVDCLEGKPCSDPQGGGSPSSEAEGEDTAGEVPAPACTVFGRAHIGLGGQDLAAKDDAPIGADRARAKPYSALVSEYARVLGAKNRPSLIDETGGTFGVAADRWYLEPLASGVFLNTAFNVAFEGCLKMTGDLPGGTADPRFATAPSAGSARSVCSEWTRRFWSREATPEEIDACVSIVLDTTKETYGVPGSNETTRDVSPKRRWAYACASVLTSTGFLTY